ncbi:MAG: SH3 domain-containing protein, partial [Clostridia bacterium]|nr:SH3 domain-containing protein [Clostridia bacterium]
YIYAKYINLVQLLNTSSSGTSSSAGYINASGVILRTGPDTRYKSLGKLARNTSVKIVGSFGGWYQIEVPSAKLTGYTLAKYVTLVSAVKSDTTIGVVTGNLNLRAQASSASGSKILLVMPKGSTVTIYSTVNGWCYVDYQGTKGYCSLAYLKIG